MGTSAPFEPHPVRGRFNAGFFTAFDRPIDQQSRDRKRKIFSGLPSEVVEVGPGVGANLRYMPPGCRVIAIEPNPGVSCGPAGGTRSWSMSRRPRAPSFAGSSTPSGDRGHGSSRAARASATSGR